MTLPAGLSLYLPLQGAYVVLGRKFGRRRQIPKSGVFSCPIRLFAPLHVHVQDLTANIFIAGLPQDEKLPSWERRPAMRRSVGAFLVGAKIRPSPRVQPGQLKL